jgi:hypothetical protein
VTRTTVQTAGLAAGGVVAAVALSAAANWRLALLALLAAAAIGATRVRYARLAALGLLVVMLGLASAGLSAGSDDRAASDTTSCAASTATRADGLAAVRARGTSCATARGVLRAWLARGPRGRREPVRGFRCRTPAGGGARVTCRRGELRVSASYGRSG